MQPQYNIHFIGPVGTLADGYAFHARGLLRTLSKNPRLNLKVTSSEPPNPNAVFSTDPFVVEILKSSKDKPEGDIILNFSIPHAYRKVEGKINVGYTTWETDRLPGDWVNMMNTQDVMLAPSEPVREVFIKSGVKVPVYTLPCPGQTTKDKIHVHTNNKAVTFLFTGNWIFRKNIETLVYSFCQAFDGVKNAHLVLKTWASSNDHGGRSHIEGAVRHLKDKMSAVDRPNISIITDIVEDEQLLKIINGCDVYITTSRGEGLDLGCVNALAMNKYVICDSFLGHRDLLCERVYTYDYTLTPVIDSGIPFHNSRMRWAQPDFESLVSKMVECYDLVMQKAPKVAIDMFSEEAVLDRFNSILEEITSGKARKDTVLSR